MPNLCYNSLTLNHNDVSYLQKIGEKLCQSINVDNDINFNYDDCDMYNNYDTVKSFFGVFSKDNYVFDIDEIRPIISGFNVNKSNYEINIIFDTAWSPPIEFYNHLKKNNWIINALYHVPEDESCGRFTNEQGDDYYEYSSDDKTTYQNIPEEVLDFTCLLDNEYEDDELENDNEEEDEEEEDSDNEEEEDSDNEEEDDNEDKEEDSDNEEEDDNEDKEEDSDNEEEDDNEDKEEDSDNEEEDDNEDKEEDSDDYFQLLKKYKQIMKSSNVCFNKVIFHSDDIKILNDIELRLSENLNNIDYELFNLLLPRPPIEDLSNNETVLEWNEKGWGTRCEPKVTSYTKIDNNTITFEFQTADTPPLGIYRFYVEEGWNVNALYYESQKGICGRFTNEKEEEMYHYNKHDLSSIINLPNDILEFSNLLENYEDGQ